MTKILKNKIQSAKEVFAAKFGHELTDAELVDALKAKLKEDKQIFIRRNLVSVQAEDLVKMLELLTNAA